MPRFVRRLILFLALAVFAQWLVVRVTGTAYTPEMYRELQEALARDCDTVIVGDSTLGWTASTDMDKRSTPTMLDDLMPEMRVFNYWHEAYHAEVYLPLCAGLVRGKHRPDAVILEVNLHSFAPVWDAYPQYQFERDIGELSFMNTPFHFLLRPLLVFGAFDGESITQSEYERRIVYDGDTPVGKVADFRVRYFNTFSTENLRKRVVANYMGDIDPLHPKLAALEDCIRIFKVKGIRTYTYITPVDWQTCRESVGDRFFVQLEKNVQGVKEAVRAAGGIILDCSRLLETDAFDWRIDSYPNEHLNQNGRIVLAQALRDWIQKDQAVR